MTAREVNFDGLPGLTHHYAGLSFGNEASTRHRYRVSNPQLAAKQGLKKMKALADAEMCIRDRPGRGGRQKVRATVSCSDDGHNGLPSLC